ncbi:hypothetical protein ACKVEX_13645 [Rhodocyclaceae bacterium SMB388]
MNMDEQEQISPRRRLQALLAIPDRDRTDAEWDELNELEISLAPVNRIGGPEPGARKMSTPGRARQARPGQKPQARSPQGAAGQQGEGGAQPGQSPGGTPKKPFRRSPRRSPRNTAPKGNPPA